MKSEWITKSEYHGKQSFFTSEDLTKLNGENDEEKLKLLQKKCSEALAKPFERTNFPATKDFLGEKDADLFQETVIFCTVPITAQKYIKDAMKGQIKNSISDEYRKDYCYINGKSANEYSQVKTTDPLGGKSFWCAVRMIYYKEDKKKMARV